MRSASKDSKRRPWFVYIAECADSTLYIGTTTDVERRLREHNAGIGARYTAGNNPVRLLYSERHEDQAKAMRRENQLKRWSRVKKMALINGSLSQLHNLSRSRD